MATKATERQLKYDSTHIEKYYLKLHKVNDADIIEAIDENNKQGSIKKLIRQGIKKGGEK